MRIVEHLRSQGVTVHSLLCAALLLAGRGRLAAWREHSVRLLSLIDLRPFAGLGIESTLAVGVGVLRAEPEDTSKICEMAARAISVAKYLAEIGAAISWLAADGIDAQRVEDFMMANFASEGMVSNLGVLQFALGFGNLTLRSFFGPIILTAVPGEQVIGAAKVNGVLCLTHTSMTPFPERLTNIEELLATAVAV